MLHGSVHRINGFLHKEGKYRYKNYITERLYSVLSKYPMTLIDPFSGDFCIGTYGLMWNIFSSVSNSSDLPWIVLVIKYLRNQSRLGTD